jgi:DNA-binding response OmpR family regulator
MKVMLVADDRGVVGPVVETLAANGHTPLWRRHGADALSPDNDADLVLLDLALSDIDVLDVLRRLRRLSATPVLVLAQRNDERSVVAALRSGADDCLVKPLRLRELLARIEAVARRYPARAERSPDPVQVGSLSVDLGARVVWVDKSPVALTETEFDVLAVLAGNVGNAVRRERILNEVWGNACHGLSRSLDVHMTSLRAKLDRPAALQTVRGFGYRLG